MTSEVRLLLLCFLFAALTRVWADLPVHCIQTQVAGTWEFRMSSNDSPKPDLCGYRQPDKSAHHLDGSYAYKLVPARTMRVELLIPNIAVTEFGNGTWTMVYDEGFYVEVAGFEFFAFNAYLPKPGTALTNIKPENYVSICHQTLVGWFHENHRWGCWGGRQVAKQFPGLVFKGPGQIKSADYAVVAPPEHRGVGEEGASSKGLIDSMLDSAQNSLSALFDTQYSFIELDAKLSGRALSSEKEKVSSLTEPLWQAHFYPEFKGKRLRDLMATHTASSGHKLDESTWPSHVAMLLSLSERIEVSSASNIRRDADENDQHEEVDGGASHPAQLWSQFNEEVENSEEVRHRRQLEEAMKRGEIPPEVAQALEEASRQAIANGVEQPPPITSFIHQTPFGSGSDDADAAARAADSLMPEPGHPVASPFELSATPTPDEIAERQRDFEAESRSDNFLGPTSPRLSSRAKALAEAAKHSGVPSAVTPAARIDQRLEQRAAAIRRRSGLGPGGRVPAAGASNLAPLTPSKPGGASLALEYVGPNADEVFDRVDSRDEKKCEFGLPCSLDWRDRFGRNWMSGVRNQGSCGSCYAMALMTVLESRLRLAHDDTKLPRFSPQHAVSCSVYNQGCDGGFPFLVAKHVEHFGTVAESCYRYTASDGVCGLTCPKPPIFPILNTRYVGGYFGATTEETMMRELMNGPISIAFESPPSLFAYRGGIFTGPKPQSEDQQVPGVRPWVHTNHAVVAVGWGETTVSGKRVKYWIMRNTWGKHWGENGYFRIIRGENDCGIESKAVAFDMVTGSDPR